MHSNFPLLFVQHSVFSLAGEMLERLGLQIDLASVKNSTPDELLCVFWVMMHDVLLPSCVTLTGKINEPVPEEEALPPLMNS